MWTNNELTEVKSAGVHVLLMDYLRICICRFPGRFSLSWQLRLALRVWVNLPLYFDVLHVLFSLSLPPYRRLFRAYTEKKCKCLKTKRQKRTFEPEGDEESTQWRLLHKEDLTALMLQTASTSETSANFFQTSRRNIPKTAVRTLNLLSAWRLFSWLQWACIGSYF
jgi:hypothetical protein